MMDTITQEQFDSLEPAHQRVVIAKDVLAHLKAEAIVAETGVYLYPERFYDADPDIDPGKHDVLYALENHTPCHVCAKGTITLELLRYGRAQQLVDGVNTAPYGEDVTSVFPNSMMEEMEAMFEGWRWVSDADEWAENRSPEQRLHDIFQHIADTDGEPGFPALIAKDLRQEPTNV